MERQAISKGVERWICRERPPEPLQNSKLELVENKSSSRGGLLKRDLKSSFKQEVEVVEDEYRRRKDRQAQKNWKMDLWRKTSKTLVEFKIGAGGKQIKQ